MVQVERNAAGRAVDIDRSVVEPKPSPEVARQRGACQNICVAAGAGPGKRRRWRQGAEQSSGGSDVTGRLDEGIVELLRADFDDRGAVGNVALLFQLHEQRQYARTHSHGCTPRPRRTIATPSRSVKLTQIG